MALMNIGDVKPGMVLATEAKTPDGRLLLPAGAELTEAHLDLFQRFDLLEVDVEAEVADDDLEAAAAYVHRFFMYVDHGDQVMNLLFQAALGRTAAAFGAGWEPQELDPRIAANNEHLDDMFLRDEGTVQDMVEDEEAIASFPDVYFRLRDVLESPDATVADLAGVVNTDVGLSARLLRLVNSPFYGFSASIDTVERAIALVGHAELSTLALGISAINYFTDIPEELVNMRTFWKHSLACAVLSASIAAKAGNLPTEQLFTAGLLHDIGRLILFKKLPYASVQTLLYARENHVPLVEAEFLVYGFEHPEVADALMEAWSFPESLRTLVACHHSPSLAADLHRGAAVIQLADCAAHAMAVSEGGSFVVPSIEPETLELLGLTLTDLEEILVAFDLAFEDTAGAFL